MVDLLRHVGVVPEAVVGHSSGEIAAAYDTMLTPLIWRGLSNSFLDTVPIL